MPSYAQVFGGGGNQPYLQLQTSDGTKNAYLSLSNTTAGVACVSSSAPASDCAAGTQLPLLAQDLGGNATAPKVVGLQGNPVSSTAPGSNQVLTWNGSAWGPATPSNSGTVTSVGLSMPAEFKVSGSPVTTSGTLAVNKANQNPNLFYAGPSSGSAAAPTFRSLVSADLPAATSTAMGAIQLGSDITGPAASPVVDGLQGRPVASTAPTANQVLTWNGTAWTPATPSGGGGGAGLPSSWTVNGTTNAVTAQLASGQDAVPLSLAPNVTSPTADLFDVYKDQGLTTKVLWIGANGNLHFTGNDLSLGTSGQTMPSYAQVFGGGGNQPYLQLQTSDGTKNAYLSLSNTTAGVACISSSAPGSDCAAGTQLPLLAQDLGGNATAPKVVGLQGNAVSSTAPAANQVLTWNGTAWAPANPSGGGSGTSNYVVVGHQGNTPWSSNNYFPLVGYDYVGAESFVQAPMPAGTATVIYFNTAGVAPGTGNSITLTLRENGSSTPLACTITGSATSCSLTGQSVPIAAGDLVDLLQTTSGTGPTCRLNWSIRIQGQ
jgi:hypothetical protein